MALVAQLHSIWQEKVTRFVSAIAVQVDIADEEQVIELFKQMDKTLGRLTGLVNNAAMLKPQATIEQLDAVRLKITFPSFFGLSPILTSRIFAGGSPPMHILTLMPHQAAGVYYYIATIDI